MRDLPIEIRRVLELRAERLRQPPPVPSDDATLWLAELTIGQERYALPLDQLRAAVPLRAVRPIPLSPPHVIGLLRFQGQLITALSFASLLGVRGWRYDPAVLLVVEHGTPPQLLALDSEVTPVPHPLPAAIVEEARERSSGQTIIPITTRSLTRVQLVDLDRLVAGWKETVGAR